MIKISLLGIFLLCAACSSIIEGTAQRIIVNTTPVGAHCTLLRQGEAIGVVPSTPGSVLIEKTKYDVTVQCYKEDFQQARYVNYSGTAAITFGNIVNGGIGWAIDSGSGADNKYEGLVTVTLIPAPRQYPSASRRQLRRLDTKT